MQTKMTIPDSAAFRRPEAVAGRDWFRIENAADAEQADVYIYDEIGWFGVSADDFVRELRDIAAPKIMLHVNSPGGSVFDGITIYNALLDHPAEVTSKVDGLAASAASFIVQAGAKRVMGRNATMMIHDASGLVIGQAEDMRHMAGLLDKVSGNIASIYNDRADRADPDTLEGWRDAMRAETWYTADEAVEAGLADEVVPLPQRDDDDEPPSAKWDLSMFRYPGREHAPAPQPVTPTGPPPSPSPEGEDDPVLPASSAGSSTDQIRAGLRAGRHESIRQTIKEASRA